MHPVKNQSIFYVVARIAHDGDCGILSCWKFVVAHQLDRLRLDHGLLWINGQVQQRIDAIELVVPNGANSLFPHGTLVRVAGRLVMVRVRNKASNCAE